MSVITTADNKRDELIAKLKYIQIELKEAFELVEEMIDSNTYGGKDWNNDFIKEAYELMRYLNETRLKLRLWRFFGQ